MICNDCITRVKVNDSLPKEEIDCRIRCIINKIYKCDYVRNIRIDRLHPIGYKISFPLNSHERPFSLAVEAEGEDFFKILEDLLREASLNSVDFFEVSLPDGHPEVVYTNNIKGNTNPNFYSRQEKTIYEVE